MQYGRLRSLVAGKSPNHIVEGIAFTTMRSNLAEKEMSAVKRTSI
jgi:hypothetical protein